LIAFPKFPKIAPKTALNTGLNKPLKDPKEGRIPMNPQIRLKIAKEPLPDIPYIPYIPNWIPKEGRIPMNPIGSLRKPGALEGLGPAPSRL